MRPPSSVRFEPVSSFELSVGDTRLRQGSKSFFAASLLLPRPVRQAAYVLYAFCREADDAIDRGGGMMAIARLRDQLARIYSDDPGPASIDLSMAALVRTWNIPRETLEALLEGFEWDAAGQRYEDFSALEAYAVRVAGTVGVMMTMLMGVRAPWILMRACELGVAMQLTNIARDVGEDARNGRLYLPRSWLRAEGIDPEAWLAVPVFSPGIRVTVARLLAEAQRRYGAVEDGLAALPLRCRPGIRAAALLYADIGREIERNDFDSVSRRAMVPAARKLALLLLALRPSLRRPTGVSISGVAAQRLLAWIPASPARIAGDDTQTSAEALPWWHLRQRLIRMIEIFERLERVERAAEHERIAGRS